MSRAVGLERERRDVLAVADIPHPQANEITGTKFTVDGQIEQGEFAPPNGELQSNANSPDLFELERRLLANELALVPGRTNGGCVFSCSHY